MGGAATALREKQTNECGEVHDAAEQMSTMETPQSRATEAGIGPNRMCATGGAPPGCLINVMNCIT